MKKLLYAFLIAAVAAVHSGCKDDEETFVHVEKVSIDVRELHLNPGKTYQLSVTIEPADATNRRIAWYSSNTNVATVDKSGLVTALAFGEVTLTAEANDMHVNDAIRLTIDDVDNSIPIESLTLDATSKTFDFAADPGVGAFRFAPAILPENATNKKLKWTSDDPLVAGIDDNGLLVPVSHGKTTIRVSTTDGGNKTARCEVTVIGVKDRNYDSADDYYKIIYFPVNITVKDENGQDTEQTWLDRNLGAKGIAAASNDHTAFGSLFQWSRKADGHEKTKWTSATAGSFVNALAPLNTPTADRRESGREGFMPTNKEPHDWARDDTSNRDGLWGGRFEDKTYAAPLDAVEKPSRVRVQDVRAEYEIRRVAEKQLKSAAVVLKPVLRFGQRGRACAQALGLFAAVLAVCAGASLGGDGDGHAAVGHGVEAQCLHDHKFGNVAIV